MGRGVAYGGTTSTASSAISGNNKEAFADDCNYWRSPYSSPARTRQEEEGAITSSSSPITTINRSRDSSSATQSSSASITSHAASATSTTKSMTLVSATDNALSQQDAGSYRCDEEDCLFLCSSVCSSSSSSSGRHSRRSFHALIQLVVLIFSKINKKNNPKQQDFLLLVRSYILRKSLLEALSTCPTDVTTCATADPREFHLQRQATMTLATLFYILSNFFTSSRGKTIISFLDSPTTKNRDFDLLNKTYASISCIPTILFAKSYPVHLPLQLSPQICNKTTSKIAKICQDDQDPSFAVNNNNYGSPLDPTRLGRARRGRKRRLDISGLSQQQEDAEDTQLQKQLVETNQSTTNEAQKQKQERTLVLRRKALARHQTAASSEDELLFSFESNNPSIVATEIHPAATNNCIKSANTHDLFQQKIVPIILYLWSTQTNKEEDNNNRNYSAISTSNIDGINNSYCTIPASYDGEEDLTQQHVPLTLICGHLAIHGMQKMLLGAADDRNENDDIIIDNDDKNMKQDDVCNLILRQSGCLTNLVVLAKELCLDMINVISTLPSTSNNQHKQEKSTAICCCRGVIFRNEPSKHRFCSVCLSLLQKRFDTLLSILDYASLTPENKQIATTMLSDSSKNMSFVQSLLCLVNVCHLYILQDGGFDDDTTSIVPSISNLWVQDVTSSCMSVLTSLGHENRHVGEAILRDLRAATMSGDDTIKTASSYEPNVTSADILDILYLNALILDSTASRGNDDGNPAAKAEKIPYDICMYCLNVLTNTVETMAEHAKESIWKKTLMKQNCGFRHTEFFKKEKENETFETSTTPFLQWLTSWIARLIKEAFRSSFLDRAVSKGHSVDQNNHASSDEDLLSRNEEECLVMAGHGCILLAWLMKTNCSQETNNNSSNGGDNDFYSLLIRRFVIQELNQLVAITKHSDSNDDCAIDVMVRTLKAFINYYLYSVGEASIVVVAPIAQLISDLEAVKEGVD